MKKVIAYAHTHWDREWYRPFEEFRLRLVEVIDRLIEDLSSGKLPSFYFDGQTVAVEDYLDLFPEKKEIIKKLIQQKKLFIGPFYCLSDIFLVNAECLIRNLELGIEKSKELGEKEFIAYLADTFGHSKGFVPILRYFGLKNIFMWRGLPETPSEFDWCGLKATNLARGYFQNIFCTKNMSIEKKAELLSKELDLIAKNSSDVLLLPIGGDHLACPSDLKKNIEKINKYLKEYKIVLQSPFDYIEEVKNNYTQKYDCEFLDNSKTFLLKGVYSSRIYLKQKNAILQWKLSRITEPLQAIFNNLQLSKNYQTQCNYAYKELIKNHAHDSIYGCSLDEVHNEMMTRFQKVETITNGVIKRISRDCSEDDNKFSVVNLSNFEYSGAVRIFTHKRIKNAQIINKKRGFTDNKLYDIDDVPVTEDMTNIYEYLVDVKNVAPFSSNAIENCTKGIKKTLNLSDKKIENYKIGLFVENSDITIWDKKNNKKYNAFLSFTDRADVGDSYNFGALKNDEPVSAKLVMSKIIQNGDVQGILRLFYDILVPDYSMDNLRSKRVVKHRLLVDVILQNQNSYLQFKIKWENCVKNHIFQAIFKLQNKIKEVISEDTTGVIERTFDTDYDIYKHIPAEKGQELKTNTAPFQRFVTTQGVCIITKGLQEYEVEKNHLKITLMRATGMISNPVNPTRGTPAGPPISVEGLQCLGKQSAEFAVCFVGNNIPKCFKNTEKFYEPTVCIEKEFTKIFLPEFDFKTNMILSVRTNSDGKLVARIYNKQTYEISDFNISIQS